MNSKQFLFKLTVLATDDKYFVEHYYNGSVKLPHSKKARLQKLVDSSLDAPKAAIFLKLNRNYWIEASFAEMI